MRSHLVHSFASWAGLNLSFLGAVALLSREICSTTGLGDTFPVEMAAFPP